MRVSLVVFMLVACGDDVPASRCATTANCAIGERCVNGFCVPGADASRDAARDAVDSSVDSSVDTSPDVTEGDAGVPAAEQFNNALRAWAEICACRCEGFGYRSAATCAASNWYSPSVRMCYVASAASESLDAFLCRAEADAEAVICLVEAECDPAALDRCGALNSDALAACPAISADQVAEFVARVNECISGSSGACPTSSSAEVGPGVVTGTTIGAGNDFAASCGSVAPDVALEWQAPTRGMWVIDTLGSDFDTSLAVFSGCADSTAEIECNDDLSDDNRSSSVTLTLDMGDRILIVVDSILPDRGATYIVTINPGSPAKPAAFGLRISPPLASGYLTAPRTAR